jgi:hypothetical protein
MANESMSIRTFLRLTFEYVLYVNWVRFSSKQATVTGPTPFGTGVINEALGTTDSKSTSAPGAPTSTTIAPGLIMSPVISFDFPVAEIMTSLVASV